jgi:hypothetical protein
MDSTKKLNLTFPENRKIDKIDKMKQNVDSSHEFMKKKMVSQQLFK